jgi:dodecin
MGILLCEWEASIGMKEDSMSVARVTEISATNPESFEAAINEGIARATSTLRNVEGAWVKDMNVLISDNNIIGYKVNLAVTFVLEDSQDVS